MLFHSLYDTVNFIILSVIAIISIECVDSEVQVHRLLVLEELPIIFKFSGVWKKDRKQVWLTNWDHKN